MKKKILIFSTSRADFNYTFKIFSILKKKFITKFVITGTHFSKFSSLDYVLKISKKKDFIFLSKKKRNDFHSKDRIQYYEELINPTYKILKKFNPDLVILLGDRFELMSIAQLSVLLKIPICHFYGGETKSYYNIDTQIRNAITKMSHLHFTSSEFAKKNLISFGENKKNIFSVGKFHISNDNLKQKNSIPAFKKIKDKKFALVTFHPISICRKTTLNEIENLINALKFFKDIIFIWCGLNSDPGNDLIYKKINNLCKNNKNHLFLRKGFGGNNFYVALEKCQFFIGNSSSIFLECAELNVPAINVGVRQQGRLLSKNIFSIPSKKNLLINIIKKILKLKKTKNVLNKTKIENSKKTIINQIHLFLKKNKVDNLLKKDK